MTFADLRQKLKSGEVSSKELVQEKLNRIKNLDPTLNSFLTVNADKALSTVQSNKDFKGGDIKEADAVRKFMSEQRIRASN